MKAPRPGSKKASVFEAFQEGGLDAALAKGRAVGVQESSVRSWVGGWKKHPVEKTNERVRLPIKGKANGRVRLLRPDPDNLEKGDIVAPEWNHSMVATITAVGPIQSEVRMKDRQRWTGEWCFMNKELVILEKSKARG